ncbi:hypothetical protein FKP32DRAFT_1689584 [Trametes sanguinea]|nr:hypothetical protein FKP32DRAFT_1689584 [Trametes sanguinea]
MAALALISTAASAAQLSTIFDAPSITTGISVPVSIENTPPVAQLDGATENVPTQDILDIDAVVLKAESGADDAVLIVEIDDDADAIVDNENEDSDDSAVGVLREERETQAAVARVLEEDIQVVVTPPNHDMADDGPSTPEEYTLRDRLLQLSAYKLAGKERLDKAATQGLTLAKLQKEKKVSRPLSRRLFKYICEKE